MSLRALIADDEPLALERMRRLLAEYNDVEIVAECRDADEVVVTIEREQIDLLFLDIEMPGGSGFEVFSRVQAERLPMVIFVTAFNEHAVRGFEVNALDYLLKPVDPVRMRSAIERARDQLQLAGGERQNEGELSTILATLQSLSAAPVIAKPERLLIHSRSKDILLELDKIEWVEAENYYARLHMGKTSFLTRETIRNLEAHLDENRFVRVHRSAIVNVARICEINRDGRRNMSLLMASGRRIPMTQAGSEKLMSVLGEGSAKSGVIRLRS